VRAFNKRLQHGCGLRIRDRWLGCLLDGTYPAIGGFVKTIPAAVGKVMKLFVKWQESARKDSERAFGMLARKFQLLARPIEHWNVEDVKNQMHGCV